MPRCSMWVHKLFYIALGLLALAACAANSQACQFPYWWHFSLYIQHPLEYISCVFTHSFQSHPRPRKSNPMRSRCALSLTHSTPQTGTSGWRRRHAHRHRRDCHTAAGCRGGLHRQPRTDCGGRVGPPGKRRPHGQRAVHGHRDPGGTHGAALGHRAADAPAGGVFQRGRAGGSAAGGAARRARQLPRRRRRRGIAVRASQRLFRPGVRRCKLHYQHPCGDVANLHSAKASS